MNIWKTIAYSWLVIWIFGCSSDPYEFMPVIKLVDNENKQFTFTNKVAGFYIGNSHEENSKKDYGWTVNKFHYLKDYRIYANNSLVQRDSLEHFKYYPFAFERTYQTPIKEIFTLLDSVNAIVWEFVLPADLTDFAFEPLLHGEIFGKTTKMGTSLSQIIFSPQELSPDGITVGTNWMGFFYINDGKNNIIVIGVIETSQDQLKNVLKHLSQKFEKKKQERFNRIASILKYNNTQTNIPEITEAISWSHLSLDALLTQQQGKGIWAGLPWFNNYLSRESFISFPGALLIPGRFTVAKEILDSFSRFQLQDESDCRDGRIPSQVTNDSIIYSNADGTWWFIRELYEYLLYSGDTGFVQKKFPAVKRAIKGAMRCRIDENFFLIHNDSETWMDARGSEGALSPRGNRAIEIQALWYTALQIGSIFAGLNHEDQLKEHWLAISQKLRENINKKFWSQVRNRAYDHLNKDGIPDKKIRPNQIFAVYVPTLPGVEQLFTDEKSVLITSNVVHKLTYRYGVASLWQEDKDFHPRHLNALYYQKDAAYYNGTIWPWLAGPVISSMLMFNRHELGFNLFFNEAIQILQDDAIGNFAERRDALPRNGQEEPAISGSISQAWSLAEFIRNFYQDFLGYRPNALINRIIISPKIPGELEFISTNLPYADNLISFTYTANDGTYNFEFKMSGKKRSVEIIFEFPGFDPVHFNLSDDDPSYSISLNSKIQKSYHRYTDLEWYFAQPELKEDSEIFQNKN